MFVSDLGHFLDLPDDTPGPARRMAEHLTLIVRAATATAPGPAWVSALPCRRRPKRQACPGHLALSRTDIPPTIQWSCSVCGDDGVIHGWEQSPFDLRARHPVRDPVNPLRVVVTPEVAATLRSLHLVDSDGERVVFRATATSRGIILAADVDDLDELVGSIAAEANHEPDRRRQKRLAAAFTVLSDALTRAPHP